MSRKANAMSSPTTQIAKQNRSAEERKRAGSCCAHPAFEHTIWHSEVRRKGASRGFRGGRFSASLNPRLVAKETHANKGEIWIRSF